ncbi:MAG: hypothetical protein ACP6KW_01755 [Candidatus Thorarchaeota archaeon]
MKLGEIEITPLAAESMGVRSLCTKVVTPDLSIVLDPSAALSKRFGLEPHPQEYKALMSAMKRIRSEVKEADILSISHYHFDHVRPGFKNCLYNLSTRDERRHMFLHKRVLAKDNREMINPSQRRRAYYFLKDVRDSVEEIRWIDGKTLEFGSTVLTHTPPVPHGERGTPLGFVICTLVSYGDHRLLFAPDVQGPVDRDTLNMFLSFRPDIAIVGGPPTYLNRFSEASRQSALFSLVRLASTVSTLVVDHHITRDEKWEEWMEPVRNASERAGNRLMTMAHLAGEDNRCLESNRRRLYEEDPPPTEFMDWCKATTEFKTENLPPL